MVAHGDLLEGVRPPGRRVVLGVVQVALGQGHLLGLVAFGTPGPQGGLREGLRQVELLHQDFAARTLGRVSFRKVLDPGGFRRPWSLIEVVFTSEDMVEVTISQGPVGGKPRTRATYVAPMSSVKEFRVLSLRTIET